MTKNNARKKAARARAAAERSSYVRAQRREREAAKPDQVHRPGGELRAPLADELIWARVLRPSVPLVYLDLNHYINLARAAGDVAHPSPTAKAPTGYLELLEASRAAKAENRVIFPLSCIHMMELSKVKNPRQRTDVALVMEELSDFNYLLGRVTLSQLEIDAGLERLWGQDPADECVPLLGSSFAHGFGRVIDLSIKDAEGRDATAALRARIGDDALTEMFAEMNLEKERFMLRGPTDEKVPDLLARGWDPDAFRRGQANRLGFEHQTSQLLTQYPEWRTGRLRDYISSRDVPHEWNDVFVKHLLERQTNGLRHDLPSAAEMPGFWGAMPQVQVAISMKTGYHRNPARPWKTNDIADIDAMSIAYPYCDAVLTDKEARSALVNDPALRRLETFMPENPHEMSEWLNRRPSVAKPNTLVRHPPVFS